jgi:LDH2 family malate/lactate/ureidoglycolate dehydrogenase
VDSGLRFRIDDLRRFASALGVGAGLVPTRAAALAAQLLWFDSAGFPACGLATLPDWLRRIESGEVNPHAEGRVQSEHAGTAVLDGQRGLQPLILARAAAIAGEKARDVGTAVVRVTNLGPAGPAAAVAAEMAIGPEIGWIVGPGPSWSLALPSAEGLPVVFESAWSGSSPTGSPPESLAKMVAPWPSLATEDEWVIGAVAVAALEPLSAFHERVSAALQGQDGHPGLLLPNRWEAHRSHAREHGVAIRRDLMADLSRWAERLRITTELPAALDK